MPTKSKQGLTAKSFSGLNAKRMAPKRTANFGIRVRMDAGTPVPVQFLTTPEGMREFDIHSFQEDGRWQYVPCVGDGCPLCADEDNRKSKVSYRFCALVYNLTEKKIQVLEGPGDLSRRIAYRYERGAAKFLKRTFEVTKFATSPVTYEVQVGEDPIVPAAQLARMENAKLDLQTYIDEEAKRYFGDELPTKTSLDAVDDDIDEDDAGEDVEQDEDELRETLEELTTAQLKARAKKNGAKVGDYKGLDDDALVELILGQEIDDYESADDSSEDEDDDDDEDEDDDDLDLEDDDLDDDDDDDEDDEDDEDDVPPPPKRTAKKTPAKKATGRRR